MHNFICAVITQSGDGNSQKCYNSVLDSTSIVGSIVTLSNTQGLQARHLRESLWGLLIIGLACTLEQFVRHCEWMLVIVSLQQGDLLGLCEENRRTNYFWISF